MDKKTQESYDLQEFCDKRNELEEEFFEALVSGKQVSEVVETAIVEADADGLDELKSLAE